MKTYVKDPDSQLDYSIDWSQWLPDGDSITGSSWIVDVPAELIIEDDTVFTGTTTTVWLSGGVAGSSYIVTNRIITTGDALPRIVDRSFRIRVKER